MSKQTQAILAALAKLDPENPQQWTSEGLPLVDAVRFLSKDPTVTRDAITATAPQFSRQNPVLPTADQPQQPQTPSSEPVRPPVATNEPGLEQGTSEPASAAPRAVQGDPALYKEMQEAEAAMRAAKQAKEAADVAFYAAQRAHSEAVRAYERTLPKDANVLNIQAYLAAQIAARRKG